MNVSMEHIVKPVGHTYAGHTGQENFHVWLKMMSTGQLKEAVQYLVNVCDSYIQQRSLQVVQAPTRAPYGSSKIPRPSCLCAHE